MDLFTLRHWNELDSAEQYIAYSRYSVLFTAVPALMFVSAVALVQVAVAHELSAFLILSTIAALLVVGITTTWAVAVHPAFNSIPRRSAGTAQKVLVAVQAVTAGVPLVVILLVDLSDATRVALATVVLCGVGSVALLPWSLTRVRWAVAVGAGLLAGWAAEVTGGSWFVGLFFASLTVLTALTVWTIRLFREIERARATEAQLKVAEERLRFAQELHDTLGQHLAAMSIKAELARALVARGDERADDELSELQKLAKLSATEMHEVVTGYRKVNLATEVAGMEALLADANIALTIRGDVSTVPDEDRNLTAWFVREAATNIVKHSNARHATLTLKPGSVTMVNDGAPNSIGPQRGLDSLRRRATREGSSIHLEHNADTFRVRLEFEDRSRKEVR
ncbi:histidine kinase [Corynebacterium breve]|uniref:Histidine kinase n=1 Tax=Corynebacterium breve TaxID=3049799 RepID=A0ABY8VDM8_9CORY|nr:histidine kinase [Corynebacterium breve]WIM67764.1 histidine kinase [Corynebacterium breve]